MKKRLKIWAILLLACLAGVGASELLSIWDQPERQAPVAGASDTEPVPARAGLAWHGRDASNGWHAE